MGKDEAATRTSVQQLPSMEEVQKELETSPEGLTAAEASTRIEKYGYNELEEKKISPLKRILSSFVGPIPFMIEAAALLSAILGRWPDFIIIMLLLVGNAIIDFWEENSASNAISALKSQLALTALVLRNKKWVDVPSRGLVPGDVVRIHIGNVIPADMHLLDGDKIKVDQAALTGESLPVSHGPGDLVYSGSVVKEGQIDGIVSATGTHTFFGKTAKLVAEAKTVSHFQRAVLKIGNYLAFLSIALVLVLFVVAMFRGDSILDFIQFALVMIVAGVPVAMPTVLSVCMAVGAQNLAKKKAVVSHLVAIEELAGIDVLCSDKTGTLTQNKLSCGKPHCIAGNSDDDIILAAVLASETDSKDPIDTAIRAEMKDKSVLESYTVKHFQPFDPVSKRTEADIVESDGASIKTSKGAPQVILELAFNKESIREEVDSAINEFASRGYRALGVAKTDAGGNWQYLGIIPLFDPPRVDSKSMIEDVNTMGVDLKMVTGDELAIAVETAKQLGMGTNIMDANVLSTGDPAKKPLVDDAIERADGFAQVFPEHKYYVVDVLQKDGHIVGMTGDGVNDAPALKKADVGVAVSGATDAARAAADIVLMAPGLTVIVDAIKQSRQIFERMSNYCIYRIAETLRLLFFITICVITFDLYPVTTIMIVLLALLNDGAILTIAYDNVPVAAKPQKWDMRLIMGVATTLGVVGVIETFGLFYLLEKVFDLPVGPDQKQAFIQTAIYLKLAVAGHLTVFVARTRGPWYKALPPAKIMLFAIFGTQLLAALISVYGLFGMQAIGWKFAGIVWLYALVMFPLEDVAKLIAVRVFGRDQEPVLLEAKAKKRKLASVQSRF